MLNNCEAMFSNTHRKGYYVVSQVLLFENRRDRLEVWDTYCVDCSVAGTFLPASEQLVVGILYLFFHPSTRWVSYECDVRLCCRGIAEQ